MKNDTFASTKFLLAALGLAFVKAGQVLVEESSKLDAMDAERYPLQMQDQYELDGLATPRVFLSAQTGQGLDLLRSALSDIVKAAMPLVVPEAADPRDLPREYPGDLH